MQSIPLKLVKRAYPLLILLAIMINTSGGLLPITRAIASRPTGCDHATFTGITDSQIKKNNAINVCYYFKQTKTPSGSNSDSDCQGSYNMPADQFCVEILQPDTTTTSCPSTTGADIAGATLYIYQTTCFYLKTSKASCTGNYKNSSPPACTAPKDSSSSSTSNATAACNTDGNCMQNSNCNQDSGQDIHTGYNDPADNNACLYTNSSITNCKSNLVHLDGSCFADSTKSSSPPAITNGLRSDGCPDTPAGTKTTPTIIPTVSTVINSQCFYPPLGTTNCATGYNPVGTTGNLFCVGYKNNAQPTAAGKQCDSASGNQGTLYVNTTTCFYLATTQNLCTDGYTLTVPDCTKSIKNDVSSGFGSNGCPVPTGVTASPKPNDAMPSQCFYQLTQGLQCATNYTSGLVSGTDCVAYINGPITPTSGQCYTPSSDSGAGSIYVSPDGSQCFFLTNDKSKCTEAFFIYKEPDCFAYTMVNKNGINGGLTLDSYSPYTQCPTKPINGVTYTLQSDGMTCSGNDSSHSTISATCPQGYVSSGNRCSFNEAIDLPDISNGPCTLKNAGEEEGGDEGEEGGPRLYTCPYANATLDCVISGSGSKAMEDCYLGTGAYSAAKTYDSSLSYYECSINSNNDPTSCTYYGPKGTAKTTQFATSACTPPANAGSSLSDCMITTCFLPNVATSRPFSTCSDSGSIAPNPQANANIIEVHIEQQCTSQRDGAVLSCTYVSTHHTTTKSRYYQITCQPNPSTPISCTPILGPYSSSLKRYCDPQDQATYISGCYTQDNANNDAWVWRANCQPYQNSQWCYPFDSDKKATNALGTVGCTSGGACTITDNSGNTMTLKDCGTAPTFNCKSTTPGCPVTTLPGATTPPIAESDLTCRGELVLDSLMTPAMTSLTIQYPLSDGELQFTLKALGVGSQSWLTQSGEGNLPFSRVGFLVRLLGKRAYRKRFGGLSWTSSDPLGSSSGVDQMTDVGSQSDSLTAELSPRMLALCLSHQ